MPGGRKVGVDVGNARVGVAVSDPAGSFALPLETLARDPEDGTDIRRLAELVVEYAAVGVVVGLPRLLSGEEGAAARIARTYAAELAQRVGDVPVRLVDERLTTVAAHRRLRESGVPGRSQRAVVDQAAAALILQSALDAESVSGRPAGELVPTSASTRTRRKKDRHR